MVTIPLLLTVDTAFCQHLLQFTITDAVFTVPAYRPQDNVALKMPAFEGVHTLLLVCRYLVRIRLVWFGTAYVARVLLGLKARN